MLHRPLQRPRLFVMDSGGGVRRGGGGRGGGRGAYYKARYGGGGGGGGGGRAGGGQSVPSSDEASRSSSSHSHAPVREIKDWSGLKQTLEAIDGQQYGAYKRLYGQYNHAAPHFTLSVDHVQGDAYAAPSRVRAIAPWSDTGLPNEYLSSNIRRVALCDYVSRIAGSVIQAKHLDQNSGSSNGGWSGPKGGAFSICAPGQEVLPRTSAIVADNGSIELRFTVSLPAAGRTVLARQAWQILGINLVEVVKRSLYHSSLNQQALQKHITIVERQKSLRDQLASRGFIAFVANGSILPRASGASQSPMTASGLVKFQSPKELEVTMTSSDGTSFVGMGIPRGVTLLTGGGFHGKSTLLEALELGIYDHIPGDGREAVVTDPTSVKIRAEDGRSVCKTDISPFIAQLPGGKDTRAFTSEDASGSTSMAANIQEALEAGCRTILIDEDSSATNLLVRDQRMEALIRNEPITPLISKVRSLYTQHGVSTVIVIGGLGDWLSVADNVVAMDDYVPRCINNQVKEILQRYPTSIKEDTDYGSAPARNFRVDLEGLRSPFATRKKFISLKGETKDAVEDPSRAESGIDLSGLDQIIEIGQSRTIAVLLERIAGLTKQEALSLTEVCQRLEKYVGIDNEMPPGHNRGDMVAVRLVEVAAALSRLRGLALRVDKMSVK